MFVCMLRWMTLVFHSKIHIRDERKTHAKCMFLSSTHRPNHMHVCVQFHVNTLQPSHIDRIFVAAVSGGVYIIRYRQIFFAR